MKFNIVALALLSGLPLRTNPRARTEPDRGPDATKNQSNEEN
jgi:hypothetical protein